MSAVQSSAVLGMECRNDKNERVISFAGIDKYLCIDNSLSKQYAEHNLSLRQTGESKRKHIRLYNTYQYMACACGKTSGHRFTKSSYHQWIRLHKKVCPLKI